MAEGACPRCSGTVTTHINICKDHDIKEGTICEECGSEFEIQTNFVCDICKHSWWVTASFPIFTEQAVKAFYYERGLDPDALYDASETEKIQETIKQVQVSSDEPFELIVSVEIGSDHLEVSLDDNAQVTNVEKGV